MRSATNRVFHLKDNLLSQQLVKSCSVWAWVGTEATDLTTNLLSFSGQKSIRQLTIVIERDERQLKKKYMQNSAISGKVVHYRRHMSDNKQTKQQQWGSDRAVSQVPAPTASRPLTSLAAEGVALLCAERRHRRRRHSCRCRSCRSGADRNVSQYVGAIWMMSDPCSRPLRHGCCCDRWQCGSVWSCTRTHGSRAARWPETRH